MRFFAVLFCVLSLAFVGSKAIAAEPDESAFFEQPGSSQPSAINVGIFETEPFVFKDSSGQWTGFDIDLWNAIADDLKIKTNFVPANTFTNLLDSVKDKKVDAGISSITITNSREQSMDFSTPYFNSGLMIMVRDTVVETGFIASVKTFFGSDLPRYWNQVDTYIYIFIIFIILTAHLAWFIERGAEGISDHYFPGIFEALSWSVVTISTVGYGDYVMKNWRGRFFTCIVILIGVGFFGLFVAKITSVMTAEKFLYEISLPRDLRGKSVATVKGTTSVPTLSYYGAKANLVDDINDSYEMLQACQVDAVVYDAPTLQYYSKNAGAGKVAAVGSIFAQQPYGIALPDGSPLREAVNRSVLKLKENGVYDRIYQHYFGID